VAAHRRGQPAAHRRSQPQIARLTTELKRWGADHRYIPLLVTAAGFGSINAYTVASEIGDIERFASPTKPCGHTGLCPRVNQSGNTDRRAPISKHGPSACAGRRSKPP
jgi:transposase